MRMTPLMMLTPAAHVIPSSPISSSSSVASLLSLSEYSSATTSPMSFATSSSATSSAANSANTTPLTVTQSLALRLPNIQSVTGFLLPRERTCALLTCRQWRLQMMAEAETAAANAIGALRNPNTTTTMRPVTTTASSLEQVLDPSLYLNATVTPGFSAVNEAHLKALIDCGVVDPQTGVIHTKLFVPFFGGEVEVFGKLVAGENDEEPRPTGEILFRASTAATKCDCSTNKVAMYLARRRFEISGIYQAVGFHRKPPGRSGLKAGGYFLTLEACMDCERYFRPRNWAKRERERERTRATTVPTGQYTSTTGESEDVKRRKFEVWQQLQQQQPSSVQTTPPMQTAVPLRAAASASHLLMPTPVRSSSIRKSAFHVSPHSSTAGVSQTSPTTSSAEQTPLMSSQTLMSPLQPILTMPSQFGRVNSLSSLQSMTSPPIDFRSQSLPPAHTTTMAYSQAHLVGLSSAHSPPTKTPPTMMNPPQPQQITNYTFAQTASFPPQTAAHMFRAHPHFQSANQVPLPAKVSPLPHPQSQSMHQQTVFAQPHYANATPQQQFYTPVMHYQRMLQPMYVQQPGGAPVPAYMISQGQFPMQTAPLQQTQPFPIVFNMPYTAQPAYTAATTPLPTSSASSSSTSSPQPQTANIPLNPQTAQILSS